MMTFLFHMRDFVMHCVFLSYSLFYLTHIVALYTFIVLLSYLMLVIYISVPVAHFVRGRGQNICRLEI